MIIFSSSNFPFKVEEGSRARVALEMRCLELEEMADKWEGVRLESAQQLEQEKEASRFHFFSSNTN